MDQKERYDQLRDGIRGCFVGAAFGDALGMPWKTVSAEKISAFTLGRGVTDLQDLPSSISCGSTESRMLELGKTGGNWQLTKTCANSIIRCREFDLIDQAMMLVVAFEETSADWNGATRQAVMQLKTWFDSRGRDGRRPKVAPMYGPDKGLDNDILIRLVPIVCLESVVACTRGYDDELSGMLERVTKFSVLTHCGNKAYRSAQLMAECFHEIFLSSDLVPKPFSPAQLLSAFSDGILPGYPDVDPKHRLTQEKSRARWLEDPIFLRETIGTGPLATESVAFTIATFLRHPTDFRAAVLETVNAGGDTDTNAAIVGALVGANIGFSRMPQEWLAKVPDTMDAINLADKFCDVLFSK